MQGRQQQMDQFLAQMLSDVTTEMVTLVTESSQVNFIYIVQYHKFASRGFAICTAYDTLCPLANMKIKCERAGSSQLNSGTLIQY